MNPVFQLLIGTWFICSTDFPMWVKGDKTNPTFNYSHTKKQDAINDEVKFLKKGREKCIKGVDHYNANDSVFTWHGNGLLRPVKSRWQIVKVAPDSSWVVIYFKKTAFTPEGVDIISRSKDLSKIQIDAIKSGLMKDPRVTKHISNLKELY